ncbi:MAG: sigma-70 family RNA polymerase sigma factor [Planctomycetota bacterium]
MNSEANPDTRLSLIIKLTDRRNDDAWAEFVQIYQPVVQRFVQRRGLQHADAAEITQEVLSRVAKSIESWDPEHRQGSFRGWLYQLTRNQTIDFLRKRKPEIAWSDVGDSGTDLSLPSETASSEFQAEYEKQLFYWATEKVRSSFKPANWQAFWKSTVEGDSIEKVAADLGMECGTVYVARSRIMSRLSALIQERMNETSIPPADE